MKKKVILSFVCLLLIWSSIAITSVRAVGTSDLETLTALGLVTSKEQQSMKKTSASLKKVDGYVLYIRLKGLDKKAKSYKGKSTYSDMKLVNKEYVPYVKYSKANPALGWDNKSGKFNPNSSILYKNYVGFMLDALGYKEGTDYPKGEQMNFAFELYLISSSDLSKANKKITNHEAHTLILSSLQTFRKDDQLFSNYLVKAKVITKNAVTKYKLHISNEESNLEQREIEIVEEEA